MSVPNVVVTGIGATTPLAGNITDTWDAVLAGKSGIAPLAQQEWIEEHGLSVTFAGQLAVSADQVLTRPEQRRMDPSTQYAIIAARAAWEDAGKPEIDGDRLGAVVSSGIGGLWTLLDGWDNMKAKGARRVLPMTIPMLMPNSPAGYVSMEFGAAAGSHAAVSACASGAEAIALATRMIQDGEADVVITGGTEAVIHPLPIAAFAAMQALSTRNESPMTASRPYDLNRDGFVLSEGSGIVVLESETHALARGAKIYGQISGYGMSADAHHIAAPEPNGRGQLAAMRKALASAGLSPDDIHHVNSHGTSTPTGDMIEARAIQELVGARSNEVLLTSTKSMTGHLLGAAGSLETIFALLALRDRKVPPTINVTDVEPELELDLVRDTARDIPGDHQLHAINNSFGFGGHNVALIVSSY